MRLAAGTQSAASGANLEARGRSPQFHVAVLARDAPLLIGRHFEASAGEVDREAPLRTSAGAEYCIITVVNRDWWLTVIGRHAPVTIARRCEVDFCTPRFRIEHIIGRNLVRFGEEPQFSFNR